MNKSRTNLFALLLGVAVLTSAGCAPSTTTQEDPNVDHREATAELDELFRIAQDAVGGEWDINDGGAEACALPSGETGAQFGFARYGAGVPLDQQQAVVDAVVAGWTARDFVPTLGTSTLPDAELTTVRYPASGWGDDGLYLDFHVSDKGSSLLGQTRCVPGDHLEINKELIAEQTSEPFTPTPTPTAD
jgi:hypothetical protein